MSGSTPNPNTSFSNGFLRPLVLFVSGGVCSLSIMYLLNRRKKKHYRRSYNSDHASSSNTLLTEDQFREAGHKMVDWIANYRSEVNNYPVRSEVSPGYLAKLLPSEAPHEGESWKSIMDDVDRCIVPGLTHWESSKFFAYFKPTASYPSVLGELLCAGLNVMGFSWISSPACTELETLTLDWLAKALDLPDVFLSHGESSDEWKGGGVIQGSAGEAAVVALLGAKAKALRGCLNEAEVNSRTSRLVVYCSDQAHSIIENACMIVGIPFQRIRKIATTRATEFTLSPIELERSIDIDVCKGLIPCFCTATTGTTSSTAFDPIRTIGHVCQAKNVWLHIDAAYGGAYAICQEYRYLFDGLEFVDSIVVNAHKKLLVNFDCACMWLKDRSSVNEALALDPEYLKNKQSNDGIVIDYKDWQIPLGRRFRALKLWFVLRSFGIEGIQSHIRNGVACATFFAKKLEASSLFEIYIENKVALVCFRMKWPKKEKSNEIQMKLKEAVNATGDVFIIHTMLGNDIVLRLAVGGIEHTFSDVLLAFKIIERESENILNTEFDSLTLDESESLSE